MEVLEPNIQDSDNNYTRFVVISREPRVYPGANRTSLMITTANEPGALYRVLERFYALNINLIKLESRPIPRHDFEFMFYFDLDCPLAARPSTICSIPSTTCAKASPTLAATRRCSR